MSNLVATSAIESALIGGDLSKLDSMQRVSYYKQVCESIGLNPLTKPFEYITLNGKLTLYAKRDATDQLRAVNKVSITIKSREIIGDIYVVTACAKDAGGREDESTGAVNIKGLVGEALANAYMKAETKAKRRVTLSVCGLGMLDETEVETIKEAKPSIIQASVEELAHDPGLYIGTFGKFFGQQIKDVPPYELDNYVQYIYSSAKTKNVELTGEALIFVEFAEAFLKTKEVPEKEPPKPRKQTDAVLAGPSQMVADFVAKTEAKK